MFRFSPGHNNCNGRVALSELFGGESQSVQTDIICLAHNWPLVKFSNSMNALISIERLVQSGSTAWELTMVSTAFINIV